jgi:hypothetical protein
MQLSLHHESIVDALREVVQAAGGPKKVGAAMYPEKTAEDAAGRIRDCLNPDRREHFTPEQVTYLVRLGRGIGCHALMTYLSRSGGYADPRPIEPEDEVARLQREFIEATKNLGSLAAKIEAIQSTTLRRVS